LHPIEELIVPRPIDLTKVRKSLAFQSRPPSERPGRTLELRISVSQSANETGLIWHIKGLHPQPGGEGRSASSAAAMLGILAIRLSEMEGASGDTPLPPPTPRLSSARPNDAETAHYVRSCAATTIRADVRAAMREFQQSAHDEARSRISSQR